MSSIRVFASRLRAVFGSSRRDRKLADELGSHIEMETEANIRRGMSKDEARYAALRGFGGVT
jgi:macrolide transport system ATP-binding/permease protein